MSEGICLGHLQLGFKVLGFCLGHARTKPLAGLCRYVSVLVLSVVLWCLGKTMPSKRIQVENESYLFGKHA